MDWQPQRSGSGTSAGADTGGDQYGRCCSSAASRVVRARETSSGGVLGETLPRSPNSLPVILARASEYADRIRSFLAASFGRLLQPEYVDRRTILARHRDKVVLFNLLERRAGGAGVSGEGIDQSVAELNGNLDRWMIF